MNILKLINFLKFDLFQLKKSSIVTIFTLITLFLLFDFGAEATPEELKLIPPITTDSQGAQLTLNEIYQKNYLQKTSLLDLFINLETELDKYKLSDSIKNYSPENIEKTYNRLYARPEIKTLFDKYLLNLERFLIQDLGLTVRRDSNSRILYITGSDHPQYTQLGRFLNAAAFNEKYILKISTFSWSVFT
jgi:hypothetical protein